MLKTPILSQLDSRWSWKTLGFSTATIGGFGCILDCLTALAGESDVGKINELFKSFGDYAKGNGNAPFLGNLIVWGNVPNALKNLKFQERGWTYDNAKVKAWIDKGFPAIVQVDAAPIGAPRSDHYILYVGDQKCMDPYTGKIRPTSDFPGVMGYALYEVLNTNPYKAKVETLKVAVDRLKSELDTQFGNANKEQTYNDTMAKIKRIQETGTL